MIKSVLKRIYGCDEGTFGYLLFEGGLGCFTGELPWRDNAPDKSCIPPGIYSCSWRLSSKHGLCYHVDGVPGRSGVEIHSANFMGDACKGLKCELLGCIAPGMMLGILDGQRAVLYSQAALEALTSQLKGQPFDLEIGGLQ